MKVLILANNDVGLYKFRRELIEALLKAHDVHICLPQGEYIPELTKMGCSYHECNLDRRGTSVFADIKLILFYKSLLKSVQPDIVFTYTIKPNVYAGMVCASMNIPYVVNVTGLGTAIENGGVMQKFLLLLYKIGLRKAQKIFFQNKSNLDFMVQRGIVTKNYHLLPGSGVNLDEHKKESYPSNSDPLVFVNIGRIMKDKGSDEVLYAAHRIRQEYPNAVFRVIGSFDGNYKEKIECAVNAGDIEYLGQQSDIHTHLKHSHAIIHASYHEGMSNVLLEAAACARPVVATDVPGCRETYEDGVSGISCKARDKNDLVRAIRDFIDLPHDKKEAMGLAGRQKAENEFDRNIVVQGYLAEIEKIKIK